MPEFQGDEEQLHCVAQTIMSPDLPEMFWRLQTCHCDDLVTDSTVRSQGYGKILIDGLRVLATNEV